MVMDLMPRGDSVIKYGYFEVKPEITSEVWQADTPDFIIQVQTDLKTTPKKIVCVYVDDKENIITDGASIFYGTISGNGYSITANNTSSGRSEDVSFLVPDALYTRYDGSTSVLYLHILQWARVKCGKWMWIAIYDE